MPSNSIRTATILSAVITLLATQGAVAQTTYRWIDKQTGQTVFSDQPPPKGVKLISSSTGSLERSNNQDIPFATKRAMQKYPVTLLTATNCTEPCADARGFLKERGIPFQEKTAKSDEEAKMLFSTIDPPKPTFPTIRVGTHQYQVGFEATRWGSLLDLAGYPKEAPYGMKAGTENVPPPEQPNKTQ